jgi:hypothetical protein
MPHMRIEHADAFHNILNASCLPSGIGIGLKQPANEIRLLSDSNIEGGSVVLQGGTVLYGNAFAEHGLQRKTYEKKIPTWKLYIFHSADHLAIAVIGQSASRMDIDKLIGIAGALEHVPQTPHR